VNEGVDAQSSTTRVLVVDDHPLFRAGLVTVLEREADMKVVGQVGTLDEAIQVAENTPVDLAIVDIVLTQGDGIKATRALRQKSSETKVLGLSVLDEPVRVAEMLRAGANSFVHKTQPIPEIVDAIRVTRTGQRYLAPALREDLERLLSSESKLPLEKLTAREREVFLLLVRGYSNERAATHLGIAPRTVETHRQRVMKKLGAHSVAELVRLAARWGALN
jgi:two-component system uhpT operon response regulator UhpA